MIFRCHPLKVTLAAADSLHFPPGTIGNTLRGGLGAALRASWCRADCPGARFCPRSGSCEYARIFEPGANRPSPSGFRDLPRPFVIRARDLDGRTFEPREPFHFALHLFDPNIREVIARSLAQLRVAKLRFAELISLEILEPVSIDLQSAPEARAVRVRFLSPAELKSGNGLAHAPEFPILFARIRDRLSTLRALYGGGPLDIDFRCLAARAEDIRMTRCSIQRVEAFRTSGKTGQTHAMGGFTGEAEYEGNLAE
ncbi:MAG: hypothetical protein M3Z23_14480, partial [Acidobacteriota bacterium]|nr:hypothetical protein [Acidobacteriota bacterium]